MYLDVAEEKMLRAIMQSAVAAASTGHSFIGQFRRFVISAKRFDVHESGVVEVAVTVRLKRVQIPYARYTILLSSAEKNEQFLKMVL